MSFLKKSIVSILSLTVPVGAITTFAQAQAPAQAPGDEDATQQVRTEPGAVFAMTNAIDNRIVSYRRAADGELTLVGSVATGGNGIGVDLDTQDPLVLSEDHRYLYAANAGSDDISVFGVDGANLRFLQKIYAGDQPNSITLHEDLLYVLDGSVAGNGILGFNVGSDGMLSPVPESFRLLSSPIAVPGEVQFSPDGKMLVVTQKTTNVGLSPENALDVFRVRDDGTTDATPKRVASHGLRPFSLAFRDDGRLAVVEAFNAADNRSAVSSYRLTSNGSLDVISGSVRNRQTDGCWIVITDDQRYAYTANFGSGTISSYRFESDGQIRLIRGRAAFLGALSQPVDLALSDDSDYLHLLLRGTGAVASFEIRANGSLRSLGIVEGGLPVADGVSGLAAY